MSLISLLISSLLLLFFVSETKQLSDKPLKMNAYTIKEQLKIVDEEGFYTNTSASINSYGKIIVLDQGNKRVQIYNNKGKLETEFGKEGSGPGEFSMPFSLNSTKERILVRNEMRLEIFDLNGKFISELPLAAAGGMPEILINEKSIIFKIEGNSEFKMIVYDLNGKEIKKIANPDFKNIDDESRQGVQMIIGFGANYVPFNNLLVKKEKGAYKLNFYDEQFNIKKTLNKNFSRVKRDMSKYKMKINIQDDNMSKEQKAEMEANALRNMVKNMGEFEDDVKSILGVFDNKIFLNTAESKDGNLIIDVIDDRDNYVSKLEVKLDNIPAREIRIEQNLLIVNYNDEINGPYVKIYSISKN